jgi:C-terminal processing protease CtpA/Prc
MTAYLRLGDLDDPKNRQGFLHFLKESFGVLQEKNLPNLILDFRGAVGDNPEIIETLLSYITASKIVVEKRGKIKFNGIDPSFKPFLSTADRRLMDGKTGINIKETHDGYFVERVGKRKRISISPKKWTHDKNLYVIAGNENVASAFFALAVIKAHSLGDIVGENSGGNLLGGNGEGYLRLQLPHSKGAFQLPAFHIEYDFGLKAWDQGIAPDIAVPLTPEAIAEGSDPVILKIKELIQKGHVTGRK